MTCTPPKADGDDLNWALSSSAAQHTAASVFDPFSIRFPAPFSIQFSIRLLYSAENKTKHKKTKKTNKGLVSTESIANHSDPRARLVAIECFIRCRDLRAHEHSSAFTGRRIFCLGARPNVLNNFY